MVGPSEFAVKMIESGRFKKGDVVVSLGCGSGNDELYFAENGVVGIFVDQITFRRVRRTSGPSALTYLPGFLAFSYSVLPRCRFSRTLKGMEVHFAPDLQAKIDQLVTETGYAPDKLVADAMAGYVAEIAGTREMLDSRYDDLKSGRVKPIPGDEIEAWFREKSGAARRPPPTS